MSFFLKIDSSKAVIFTNKLEKLRRNALPNAIRNTLNKAAFHTKQVTMPVSADKHFVKRKPNFFKANSKVFMAQGYNVSTMQSTVAFVPASASYNNQAVRELEQQEHTGTINKRTFIPLQTARSGGSDDQQVLPSNRLAVIKNIVDSAKSNGRNRKEKFIRAAIHAGKKGLVIGNFNKQTLFRINSIKSVNGRMIISKTPIYSFDKGRSVRIRKATHFMREASMESAELIYLFYQDEATRQIQKTFK